MPAANVVAACAQAVALGAGCPLLARKKGIWVGMM